MWLDERRQMCAGDGDRGFWRDFGATLRGAVTYCHWPCVIPLLRIVIGVSFLASLKSS